VGVGPSTDEHGSHSFASIIEGKLARAMELSLAGDYQLLVQLLCEIKEIAELHKYPALDGLILTAQQLCSTCQDYKLEAKHQKHLLNDLTLREHKLQQHLQDVLSLLKQPELMASEVEGSALPLEIVDTEKIGNKRPNLWQRIQALIGSGLASSREKSDYFDVELSTLSSRVEPFQETKRERVLAVTSESSAVPTLTVYCLGTCRAYVNEQLIDDWKGNKSKSIFKYMVTHHDRPIPIEILIDIFWYDDEPDTARRNLYQAIYLLRQAVQTALPDIPYILSDEGCYGLNPDLKIWLDNEAFHNHYLAARKFDGEGHLLEAVHEYELADNLYTGGFLEEDIYEDWTSTLRENLRMAYLDVLSWLSQHHYEQRNWALSTAYCQKILQIDKCHEQTHRRLMRVLVFQGQRHLALRQYHYCAEALLQELDVDPMPETMNLYKKVLENRVHF
jgi:DNA-binding SARP family transcriptional activator